MKRSITQRTSTESWLRYALGLWPYLVVAVSVVGLTYIALNAAR